MPSRFKTRLNSLFSADNARVLLSSSSHARLVIFNNNNNNNPNYGMNIPIYDVTVSMKKVIMIHIKGIKIIKINNSLNNAAKDYKYVNNIKRNMSITPGGFYCHVCTRCIWAFYFYKPRFRYNID